jgi:hypothetical protein
MARIGDTIPHRDIEFGVHDNGYGTWQWAYYPKIGEGFATRGKVNGNRANAIAACKVAIDEWLGPPTAFQSSADAFPLVPTAPVDRPLRRGWGTSEQWLSSEAPQNPRKGV